MRQYFISTLILLLSVLLMAAPGTAADSKEVTLAYVAWSDAIASSNVARAVLEEKMGYTVTLSQVTASKMWANTASGKADGFVTAWLPVTHKAYYEQYKDQLVDLGPICGGAKIGLVVPQYVTIGTIPELNDHAEKFNRKIVGIDPEAGIMAKTKKAIQEYSLDKIELEEGLGVTMTGKLGHAIARDQWIVVTGWTPHWKFNQWKLKYLDDPKGVYGGEEHINAVVRQGLKADMPEVYRFLDNFNWELRHIEQVMAWNQDNQEPYKNAKRFLKQYPKLVESWLNN